MSSEQVAHQEETLPEFFTGVYGHRGLTLDRGEGARLFDNKGRSYIDCGSMIGVTSLGHAHPSIVRAISDQASNLMACFGSFGNSRRSDVCRAIHQIVPWAKSVFLCNSGTEAIEAAYKFACHSTGRTKACHLRGSFHGRTLGALSLNANKRHRHDVEPALARNVALRANQVEDLELIDSETAAVFIEIIQGEGGVRPLEREYLQALQQSCREAGALLIVDEVQTGFGRTGRWFAYEAMGIEPDMIAMAKAMGSGFPIGGVALGARVSPPKMGVHGSTFGGNPLAAAACLATIDFMSNSGIMRRVKQLGDHAMDALRAAELSAIREIRGRGLMIGVELKVRVTGILKRLQARGVIALAAGPNVLRLLPPFVITNEDWDQALSIIIEEISRES